MNSNVLRLSLVAFATSLTRVDRAFAGRAYAAYGGIYIAASHGWLWVRARANSCRLAKGSPPRWRRAAASTSRRWPAPGANSRASNADSTEIVNALAEGYRSEAWKAELVTLDARKGELTAALAEPPLPAMHPNMANVFHQKVMALAAGLQQDEQRDAARQALRGFLEKIVIPPDDGLLQVVGNFVEMLAAASGRGRSRVEAVGYVGCGGTQPTILAALRSRSIDLAVPLRR